MRKLAFLVGLVVLAWGPGASATPVITNGLVAAYEFSGNAEDLSGNGHNGSVVGAVLAHDRFGAVGNAYSFAPLAARIEFAPVFSSHPPELTYAAWIGNWTDSWGFIYGEFTSSGRVRNGFLAGGTDWGDLTLNNYPPSGAGDAHIPSLAAFAGYEWLHVAIVQSGNLVTGYVNGEVLGTATTVGTYSGTTPFVAAIGSRYNPFAGGWVGYGDGTYQFRGIVDNLYIYDRALSPAEVSTLYSASVPEPTTGLLLGLGLLGVAVRRQA
jgi:hypothetical protein